MCTKTKYILTKFGQITLALVFLFSPCLSYSDEKDLELNQAQQLIYTESHFLTVPTGAEINYEFESNAEGVESPDRVQLKILKSYDNQKKDIEIEFLSRDNQIQFPNFMGYKGNPVIICFLERDVRQMSRTTGGGELFFRNRIRHALADDPILEKVTVEHNGENKEAYQISFMPYINAPLRERLLHFQNKVYRITLSESVPGFVAGLSTELDSESHNVKESLFLSGLTTP